MLEFYPARYRIVSLCVWNILAVESGPILIVSVKVCTINHGEENNLVVFVHHMRHTLSPNDSFEHSFDKLVSACVRENFCNILTFTLSASCPTPVSGQGYLINTIYQTNISDFGPCSFLSLWSMNLTIIRPSGSSRPSDWQNLLWRAFSFLMYFCIVVLINFTYLYHTCDCRVFTNTRNPSITPSSSWEIYFLSLQMGSDHYKETGSQWGWRQTKNWH